MGFVVLFQQKVLLYYPAWSSVPSRIPINIAHNYLSLIQVLPMINQVQPQIHIKGIREGLLISLDTLSFAEMMSLLKTEVGVKQDFLRGSRIALQVGKRPLRKSQLTQIKNLLEQHELMLWAVLTDDQETRTVAQALNLATRLAGSSTDLDGNKVARAIEEANIKEETVSNSLLIKETLRSGRSIHHEGSIVVIGDVNPGAEIIAGGDVIVWGRLRGLVHAGAMGDETAVICALSLNPTQLRIANQIAISPPVVHTAPIPEQAAIYNGQIVAEAWQK